MPSQSSGKKPLHAIFAVCQLLLQSQQPVVDGIALRSLALDQRVQELGDAVGRQHTLLEAGEDDFVKGRRNVAALAN